MRSHLSTTILASLLALFIISPIQAGEKAKQTGTQKAEKELVQKAVPPDEEQPAAVAQEATAGAGESPDGGTGPAAEPQAVVKTKTKSNQSND